VSPLPFGVLRVHHLHRTSAPPSTNCGLHCLSAFSAFTTPEWVFSYQLPSYRLHCLSAFSAFTTTQKELERSANTIVSIAFRRSPRSPLSESVVGLVFFALGLHCLSAFSAFTTERRRRLSPGVSDWVSIAFRRSPRSPRDKAALDAWGWQPGVSIAFRRSPRSPPQRVIARGKTLEEASPLPFGVLRVHH